MTVEQQLKEITENLGYGHSMHIISALWRAQLKEMKLPESGAFLPVCDIDIKPETLLFVNKQANYYDGLIKERTK